MKLLWITLFLVITGAVRVHQLRKPGASINASAPVPNKGGNRTLKIATNLHKGKKPLILPSADIPVGLVVRRMENDQHFGSPSCPCVGLANIEGSAQVYFGGKAVDYPVDVGGTCEAWDDGREPDNCLDDTQSPGKGKGWCAQKWCYVDPCNCDVTTPPKQITYFKGAMVQGLGAYYSYATCGSKDDWTAENKENPCVTQKNAADCSAIQDCTWDDGHCLGWELQGLCGAKREAPWNVMLGKESCPCIGVYGLTGTMEGQDGQKYPAGAGSICKAWDLESNPFCDGEKQEPWCHSTWCYVDPCDCNLEETAPEAAYVMRGAFYQGKPIYYSYTTCGSQDTWSEMHNKAGCKNQKTEETCGTNWDCSWFEGKCVGWELAGICEAYDEQQEKSLEKGLPMAPIDVKDQTAVKENDPGAPEPPPPTPPAVKEELHHFVPPGVKYPNWEPVTVTQPPYQKYDAKDHSGCVAACAPNPPLSHCVTTCERKVYQCIDTQPDYEEWKKDPWRPYLKCQQDVLKESKEHASGDAKYSPA